MPSSVTKELNRIMEQIMRGDLLEAMDNRVSSDYMYMNRSDYIRSAVREQLKQEGFIE